MSNEISNMGMMGVRILFSKEMKYIGMGTFKIVPI